MPVNTHSMNATPVVVERLFDVPIMQVWDALVNNEKLKQWYFQLPEFKAEVGFEFSFTGGPDESRQYKHLCRVTVVIPGRKLAYTWKFDGYPGNSEVSFELFEEGPKTRVVLTHTGLDSFSGSGPDFARSNFEQGWTSILDQSLESFLLRRPASA